MWVFASGLLPFGLLGERREVHHEVFSESLFKKTEATPCILIYIYGLQDFWKRLGMDIRKSAAEG